jgi:hypothetical protein
VATEAQKRMEGAPVDRKGKALNFLEDALSGTSPWCSVSADPAIFPYGQAIKLDAWPNIMFRVTDTGSHFMGASKVFRVSGREPLDIATRSKDAKIITLATASIVKGDTLDKPGKEVAVNKFQGQNVVGVLCDIHDGYTSLDQEALARMIESETGGGTKEEQAAAAWTVKNRAAKLGLSVHETLAPTGLYGAPSVSEGYASTRKPASAASIAIALEVLSSNTDPTQGAVYFWSPSLQDRFKTLSDIYWTSEAAGDTDRAKKYERYAKYTCAADDVRAKLVSSGFFGPVQIGKIETLKIGKNNVAV